MDRRELDIRRPWREFVRDNDIYDTLMYIHNFDFLLWGDAHPSNLNSTKWFIENVALHADFAWCKTLILGRAGSLMYQEFGSRSGLYYAGFVDQLDDAMHRSKLIILPDQMGSGISIKTLDTLATSRPFVATQLALRSLQFGEGSYRGAATADEFRNDCLKLLKCEIARQQRAEIARSLYDINFSRQVYYSAWDDLLRSIGLSPQATSAPIGLSLPETSQPENDVAPIRMNAPGRKVLRRTETATASIQTD